MNRLLPIGVSIVLGLSAFARGEDWPQWRGPRLDGRSTEKNLPLKWSETENIAWKTPIPGKGHSSPVVFGDRIFVTTCIESELKRQLLCIRRTDGKVLWTRDVLSAPLEGKNRHNSFASATPATDGKHVWVSFLQTPDIQLVCYDYDGKEIWRKSPGTFASKHGWGCGPILYKNLVILNCDQDAEAWIVAYDKSTGKEVWRTDRPNRTRSYCIPLIVEAAGKTQMVLTGSKCTASYDPATGKQHWLLDGPTEQFVASPVLVDNTFCITGGFPTYHLVGIRPDAKGKLIDPHVRPDSKGVAESPAPPGSTSNSPVAWHHFTKASEASYVPSLIAVDSKHFIVIADTGAATCLEARTGKRIWSEKISKHIWPSPVYADGRIYILADDGQTTVIAAGPVFKQLAVNPVGEECMASPAISQGQIFIRGAAHLFCIGTKTNK